jgi:outer membrane protein assembly factor BamD (BamD/ComL family)
MLSVSTNQNTESSEKQVRKRHRRKKQVKKSPSSSLKPLRLYEDQDVGTIHRTFMHMSFEELESEKNVLIQKKQYDSALKYLRRMLILCIDTEGSKLADLLLEVGDVLYEQKEFDKAWQAYGDWCLQYPNHVRSEHAHFRAVDACYKCTNSPDRDQTKTHKTVELANRFLQRRGEFTTHRDAVADIKTSCYEKLIDSELTICTYYRQQSEHTIVANRLRILEEEFKSVYEPTTALVTAYRDQHYPSDGPATLQNTTVIASTTESQSQTDTPSKKSHMADRF